MRILHISIQPAVTIVRRPAHTGPALHLYSSDYKQSTAIATILRQRSVIVISFRLRLRRCRRRFSLLMSPAWLDVRPSFGWRGGVSSRQQPAGEFCGGEHSNFGNSMALMHPSPDENRTCPFFPQQFRQGSKVSDELGFVTFRQNFYQNETKRKKKEKKKMVVCSFAG